MRFELTSVYRIVTFVPPQYERVVMDAILAVDPLCYGKYSGVSWSSTPGTEHFLPEPDSQPTSGEIGVVSKEPSVRLEFSIPVNSLKHLMDVVTTLVKSHPWQEPVVQIYSVQETRTFDK